MDYVFDLCVKILLVLADLFGTSYKAINVWIFVIIWPLFTLFLIVTVIRQRHRLKRQDSRNTRTVEKRDRD